MGSRYSSDGGGILGMMLSIILFFLRWIPLGFQSYDIFIFNQPRHSDVCVRVCVCWVDGVRRSSHLVKESDVSRVGSSCFLGVCKYIFIFLVTV